MKKIKYAHVLHKKTPMKLWQISEFMSTQLWLPGLDNLPALSVLSIRVQACY